MRILLVNDTKIPAIKYGGTERVIWWLGKELKKLGHKVYYLVAKGSHCPFADGVFFYNPKQPLEEQIPKKLIDIVHLHFPLREELSFPYIVTIHGNGQPGERFNRNSVFLSRNHARRHNADVFVYNGIDFSEYTPPDFTVHRDHLLFLAKARLRVKNLHSAKIIAKKAKKRLVVVGGYGLNSKWVKYKGFLNDKEKSKSINESMALLFPVRWHEPFGLAIIESLYYGTPVFGTPYGALPELVSKDVGFLSNRLIDFLDAIKNVDSYNRKLCSEYAHSQFNSQKMTLNYLKLYENVLSGETLNSKEPFAPMEYNPKELLPFYE